MESLELVIIEMRSWLAQFSTQRWWQSGVAPNQTANSRKVAGHEVVKTFLLDCPHHRQHEMALLDAFKNTELVVDADLWRERNPSKKK